MNLKTIKKNWQKKIDLIFKEGKEFSLMDFEYNFERQEITPEVAKNNMERFKNSITVDMDAGEGTIQFHSRSWINFKIAPILMMSNKEAIENYGTMKNYKSAISCYYSTKQTIQSEENCDTKLSEEQKTSHYIICHRCNKRNEFYLNPSMGRNQEEMLKQFYETPHYCVCGCGLDKSKLTWIDWKKQIRKMINESISMNDEKDIVGYFIYNSNGGCQALCDLIEDYILDYIDK